MTQSRHQPTWATHVQIQFLARRRTGRLQGLAHKSFPGSALSMSWFQRGSPTRKPCVRDQPCVSLPMLGKVPKVGSIISHSPTPSVRSSHISVEIPTSFSSQLSFDTYISRYHPPQPCLSLPSPTLPSRPTMYASISPPSSRHLGFLCFDFLGL